jgi:predicted DNA-binding transcriptional regulator AlpA
MPATCALVPNLFLFRYQSIGEVPEPVQISNCDVPRRSHHLDRRAADLAERGAAAGDPNDLLDTTETSEWLGVSSQFLEIGRHAGYGPRYVRISPRRVRYRRADVIAWLEARTHSSTAAYSAGREGRKPGSRIVDGRVLPPQEAADAAAE